MSDVIKLIGALLAAAFAWRAGMRYGRMITDREWRDDEADLAKTDDLKPQG